MRTEAPDRDSIVASIALLCLPAAFQLAAGANVPESLWSILVLSIWASLTTAALLFAGLVRLLVKFCERCRATSPVRSPRGLVRPSWR